MEIETIQILRAGHILGFTTWVGALMTALFLLRAHARATDASPFGALEKGFGIAMDVGASLAIVCGLILLLKSPMGEFHMAHGYMHMKLTAVAAFLVLHVLTRIKIKRARSATPTAPANWMVGLAAALAFITVVLIELGPVWMA